MPNNIDINMTTVSVLTNTANAAIAKVLNSFFMIFNL
jgi:hypothetical protein